MELGWVKKIKMSLNKTNLLVLNKEEHFISDGLD